MDALAAAADDDLEESTAAAAATDVGRSTDAPDLSKKPKKKLTPEQRATETFKRGQRRKRERAHAAAKAQKVAEEEKGHIVSRAAQQAALLLIGIVPGAPVGAPVGAAASSNASAPRPPKSKSSSATPSPPAPPRYGFLPGAVPPRFSPEVGDSSPSPTIDLNATPLAGHSPVAQTAAARAAAPPVVTQGRSLFGEMSKQPTAPTPGDARYYEEDVDPEVYMHDMI